MTAVMPAAYTPVPAGRGRWRITLHNRAFATNLRPDQTGIGELVDARSRRLELKANEPAVLTFSVDGHSQAAAQVVELRMDVMAWRWDENRGLDRATFRGVVAQSTDELSEQAHTTSFTAHDYLALLKRRYVTSKTPLTYAATDQDVIVNGLLGVASNATTAAGTSLSPGSFLPMVLWRVNPDGTTRAANSGQVRDRTYFGGQEIGDAIDNLADSLPPSPAPGQTSSFEYDTFPAADGMNDYSYPGGNDLLRVFWPNQGVTRTDMALVYGASGIGGVSNVSRAINSSDYANYVRVLGNNGQSDPALAQLAGEAWNTDASTGTAGAIGTWMTAENASDVTLQNTLNEQAAGELATASLLIPTYSIELCPGGYAYGFPNMGDTVPLSVHSGRLQVDTTVRVLGMTFDIGDDGQEDVTLTVGRPAVTLAAILNANRRDVNALARR